MIFSIFTILLCIVPFIAFFRQLFMSYGGDDMASLNAVFSEKNCYDYITFDFEGNPFLIAGSLLLLATLIMCGIVIILTIINNIVRLIGRFNFISVKPFAVLLFLCALAATIVYTIYMIKTTPYNSINNFYYSTVGVSLLSSVFVSLLSIVFAPKKYVAFKN